MWGRKAVALAAGTVAFAGAFASVGGTSAGAAPSSAGARPYVVVLDDDAASDLVANEHARRHGAKVKDVWSDAVRGYAADLTPAAADALARDERVASVTVDQVAHASVAITDSGLWGLDRIDDDDADANLDSSYTTTATGAGVTAYVLDTGIYTNHTNFGGRAAVRYTAPYTTRRAGDGGDCNGHGTHVAGTIGGTTFGVAKSVKLVGVRVLGCDGSGYYSSIVSGIDWMIRDHKAGVRAVANMSLGGPKDDAINAAVNRAIADGITVVVAAGNESQDALSVSPASTPAALTVGASDYNDAQASFSNWGAAVDLFAPGVSVRSARAGTSNDSLLASGTSMASPHVAGAAALVAGSASTVLTPAQVSSALMAKVQPGAVTSTTANTTTSLLNVAGL